MSFLDARAIMQPGGAFSGVGDVIAQALDRHGQNRQRQDARELEYLRTQSAMEQALAQAGGGAGGGAQRPMDPSKASREARAHWSNHLGAQEDADPMTGEAVWRFSSVPEGAPDGVHEALRQRMPGTAQRMEQGQPWSIAEQEPHLPAILQAMEGWQAGQEPQERSKLNPLRYLVGTHKGGAQGSGVDHLHAGLLAQGYSPEDAWAAKQQYGDIMAALGVDLAAPMPQDGQPMPVDGGQAGTPDEGIIARALSAVHAAGPQGEAADSGYREDDHFTPGQAPAQRRGTWHPGQIARDVARTPGAAARRLIGAPTYDEAPSGEAPQPVPRMDAGGMPPDPMVGELSQRAAVMAQQGAMSEADVAALAAAIDRGDVATLERMAELMGVTGAPQPRPMNNDSAGAIEWMRGQ